MNKHFTIGLRFGLSLLLTLGPLMPRVSANDSKTPVTDRMESKRPSIPARYPTRKKGESKPRVTQDGVAAGPGQSATLLPDGRWLLVGGEGDLMAAAAIFDPQSGEPVTLASRLSTPRMGHSATMLSDGTVLIHGGVDQRGQYVDGAELFNPDTQRFETRAATGLSPRANHTATLLTDGQLLIVGGTDARGKLTSKVELFDLRKNRAIALSAKLQVGREKHTAVLQADGTVVLSGGTDENGETRQDDEIYQPETKSLIAIARRAAQGNNAPPQLEFSTPANGDLDVDENALIALRFSERLSVKTINRVSVVLQGPLGHVETKVVPAESGMLAFITPFSSLPANSQFNLTVNGALDDSGQALPFLAITFKTKPCRNGEPGCGAGSSPQIDLDSWIPDARNLRGDWRSGRPESPSQSLPALQAPAGETALAGQVLTLSGTPLANVTLQINDRTAATDFTGRFLLRSLDPGKKVLTIQGHTASRPGKTYGTFDVLVDIAPGKTTILSYTIWLPVLDEQNAVRLSIPTRGVTKITTRRVPGMEVQVPSDAVVRLPAGAHHNHGMMKRELESVAITPMPVDRPPFPLPPGVEDGLLYTLQLHGAKVEGPNGEKRAGLRIIFPNYSRQPAGSRVRFWNYEAEAGGWYIYGEGAVSADGSQVIPDPGVELQSMHCASYMETGPTGSGTNGNGFVDGEPVDLGTGLFVYNKADLMLPDVIPIALSRTYKQNDSVARSFGKGMTSPYDIYVHGSPGTYGEIILPDGNRIHFDRTSPTAFEYECTNSPTPFYKATMKMIAGVGPNGAWEVKLQDGTVYQFGIKVLLGDILGVHASTNRLSAIQDRNGKRLTIIRDNDLRMTKIFSPNGRSVQFTYSDSSKRIATATDNTGRVVSYTYDASGRLWKVTDAKGGITEYSYDSLDRMLTIKDPRGIVYLTNEYDANGRVFRQTQADTSVYQFAYTLNGSGKVTQTDVTNPRGYLRRVTFNSAGFTLTDKLAVGTPQEQTYTYERQATTNFILSITDPLGRKVAFTYNTLGDVSSVTRLADTPNAVTTSFTYEATHGQIATVTDPLSHTVSYAYNSRGNLISVTDALNHKTRFEYNSAAELRTVIDALGNATRLNVNSGIVSELIDPLGQVSSRRIDNAGRITSVTSATGSVVKYEYDNFNQLTQTTNPLQGVTTFAYDPTGNLTSVIDARNSTTTYTYDNMDRVATRRDPLLHDDTYEYDLNGNLKKITDRKSQVTNFTYDPLNRLTSVSYGDGSTTAYTYDLANRLTQVVDSLSGTVTYVYDGLDRLTSETTPQGSVSYTYDAAGRRSTMTVAGQTAVSYTYDDANRLTQITQGSSTVAFTYDAADRRTSVTLPNGVITEYAYNAASDVTGITYKLGTTVLGNLTYEYDADGRRVKTGGSLARTLLPADVTAATYNAANHQLTFGSQTLSYDLNGNLTSDGSNTYTWDARDRLSSITGSDTTASFQYDSKGKRTSKSINGTTTSFLYDGANVVQENSALTGVANILTGGIDEIFTRSDSSGTSGFLVNDLGSSLSLTNSAGQVQTEYAYGDFGKTASSGPASVNSNQYTGRENDGTNLQFNRARYYSSTHQRFISEDPLGFKAGDSNFYAYVFNDPINFTDPSGRSILIKLVKKLPIRGKPVLGRILGFDEAVDVVKKGGDVATPGNRRLAGDIAREADPKKRRPVHDDAHESAGPGAKPHYHPFGRKGGHVFYGVAAFFAPFTMELSSRGCTTWGQFGSALAWDFAGNIDPVGVTDGIEYMVGI